MIYDDTCRGGGPLPGLTHSWIAGGWLYRALDRLDHVQPVRDWASALDWLLAVEADRPIAEIQFWGHGKWGKAKIDGVPLTVDALASDHPLNPRLDRLRRRLTGPDALWWFRTCESFGAEAGHEFARRWTDFFECRAASHTFIIGPWQSGLHLLRPGHEPDWPTTEGLAEGTPDAPEKALWSTPAQPNTITCLHGHIPEEFAT